ncbi:copper-binding protein [Pseudomonas sp. BN414]|uniref:copper-binding protein n=1 Tax=Pseudomonas sp. BN414 TaxID=2567888 RepID=UPI00245721B4|nr:copper-binding protein [Pseudomonas sp. BN414]MDH4566342.1 copper-binding protein [Pseudomonas sp. BN414]
MKNILIAITSAVAALSFPAFAEDMPGMNMDAKTTPEQQAVEQAPTAQATGTVRAIDNQKQVVTLAHSAVPSLQWPPMTMGFKATAEQLKGLKVGDRVTFEFQADGMNATIVSIKRAQE